MTRTKLYLSITLLTLLLLLNSCKKNNNQTTNSKNHWKRSKADRIETDKYIDAGDIYFQKTKLLVLITVMQKLNLSRGKRDTSRIILSLQFSKIHYLQPITLALKPQQLKYHYKKKERPCYNYNINLLLEISQLYFRL
jgi:hypothetical protein